MAPYSILRLLLAVASVSALDLPQVAKEEFNQSFVDIYVPNGHFGNRRHWSSDLYQRPLILLAPTNNTSEETSGLDAFYADNGLRSLVDYKNFESLFQMLRMNRHNYGLVLNDQVLKYNTFGLNDILKFILPEKFRLFDLLRDNFYNVPVIYVAPRTVFNSHHFVNLNHAGRFVLNDYSLDVEPFVVIPERPKNTADATGTSNDFPFGTFPTTSHPLHARLPTYYPTSDVYPWPTHYPFNLKVYGSVPANFNGRNNFNPRYTYQINPSPSAMIPYTQYQRQVSF